MHPAHRACLGCCPLLERKTCPNHVHVFYRSPKISESVGFVFWIGCADADRINGAANRHVVRRDPESDNRGVVTDERLDTRVAAWFEQKRLADVIKLASSQKYKAGRVQAAPGSPARR